MAGQTTWNKATVPAGADPWNAVPDIKKGLDTAGLVFRVANVTERNGLAALAPAGVLPIPTLVWRTDASAYESWDGTAWRQVTGLRHAEYIGPAFTTTAAVGTNFGAFTVDGAKTFNNSFVQPDAAGRVKILESGVYSLFGIILPTTVPASYALNIQDITNTTRIAAFAGIGYGDKEESIAAPNVYLAANTVIEFNLVTSNAVTLGSRIKITKVQG